MKLNSGIPLSVKKSFLHAILLVICLAQFKGQAQSTNTPLRRPVSASSPMYLMHIDTWNYADPQKIINLIPSDLRPYVVMNISLSISHNTTTGQFQVAEYGYEIAKSWLRVCAENRMWTMIQPASGGMTQARFSEFDLSVFEEFYKNYPNFIGFNYAEQFWGFDDGTDPVSAAWTDRVNHFADLLKLGNKYGGYLAVSWCGNQFSPNINPIGMLKRSPAFATACKQFTKNYILCEKYTTVAYQHDMESICLGSYLSGFSGNYGIRYDDTGWTDSTGVHQNFTMATASAPILEHAMLTGQTVIDGPELIWTQCFQETGAVSASDNYSTRNWTTFPQFDNVSVDLFRKILDGSVRIPTREEVIKRTKFAIINDVNSGSADDIYSSPQTLFEGLYRMDSSGNYQNNKSFFKKTGRYPTVPTVLQLADAAASDFQVKVNRSAYAGRWPTIASKVTEFNTLFPQEYTGDLFAGRHENGWVVYNPYKTSQAASARIPFKYNTCDSMELSFSRFSAGVIKETSGQLKIYLNNYDNVLNTGLKTDILKIYGSSSEPAWSYTDRANHQASAISGSWNGGIFTLTIRHNGPLDVTLNCAGTATGRLTAYNPALLVSPELPAAYAGPRQYEAEVFDYKNISNLVSSGSGSSIRNYTGQGYVQFGTNGAAALRKTVNVLQPGIYLLQTKYSVTGGNVATVDLFVNGLKLATPIFTQTSTTSNWSLNAQTISLRAGSNSIEFKAAGAAPFNLNIDNIVLSSANGDKYHFNNDPAGTSAANPPAYVTTLRDGTAGVVSFTDATASTGNVFKAYSNGAVNGTGVVDLDLFAAAANYSLTWKEIAIAPGGKKGLLLRGTGSSAYATGMKQGYLFQTTNNPDNTVTLQTYLVNAAGISSKTVFTSAFGIAANLPCWYRATASGNTLKFECSADSITWVGGAGTLFTDNTYPGGSTQLLWGFGSNNFSWYIDNITIHAPKLSSNKLALQGFEYAEGAGPSGSQSFAVSGQSLRSDVPVVAPANYEISLSVLSGFSNSLTIARIADSIPATNIYVRLKPGLLTNAYRGEILAGDSDNQVKVTLSGAVRLVKLYTFTDDIPGTSPATPPAANITIGTGNDASAGVISYTDAQNNTSNYLKVYGVGTSSNGTAVLDLNLFPADAVDYSVTWKQAVPDSSKQYKNGVLLRGSGVGGYSQGIKQGYLFNASNASPSSTAFRIFKSTASGIGSAIVSNTVGATLRLANNVPVWYRASVSGSAIVSLKFEYSTDSITWFPGTSITDNSAVFTSGATQFVSGLFASGNEYYLDNISFGSAPAAAAITVSESLLTSYGYTESAGPSANQSFIISGTRLADNLLVKAPPTFEISTDPATGFSTSVTVPQGTGTLAPLTIYTRLKSGLAAGNYEGAISFAYASQPGSFDNQLTLRGNVSKPVITAAAAQLTDLGYVVSGNSIVRTVIVSGATLAQNLVITSTPNFELSFTAGFGYAGSLALTPTSGIVSPTVIYIRLASGLPASDYSGSLNFTSAGADSKSLVLGGTVAAQANIFTSVSAISGLGYSIFGNIPPVRSFRVWGMPLTGDLTLAAPANFEISRSTASGFASAMTLVMVNGSVDSTLIFIRLKESLAESTYSGNLVVSSPMAADKIIPLNGTVNASRIYDFTADIPTASATNPPAANIAAGTDNGATAGVVAYTDAGGSASNRFRAYSGGARNVTGVMNLNLFSATASDYAITWKEAVGSNSDYKVGVLLRGNGPAGTATTGYVQGMLQGYLFIAYTAKGQATPSTQFRIYPSTTATSLTPYVNNQVSLVPAIGQNIWYRATVSGLSPVNLRFEYSTDSLNWVIAATATDASASAFASGATQLVWGLGSAGYNFFLDDITYGNVSGVLPVNMLSFTAVPVNSQVLLHWKTATEVNNKGFDIEHGTDAGNFVKIGFVAGNGSSTVAHIYGFTHASPANGTNYYRLKQTDLDGRSRYSKVQQVEMAKRQASLSLLGNPVYDKAILSYSSNGNHKLQLVLVDANGKTVMHREWNVSAGTNTLVLNTGLLAKGMYNIQVKDREESSIVKMMKQ